MKIVIRKKGTTIPKTNQEYLYTRYQPIALKVASNFAKRFNRPYHELAEEALHAMAIEITQRWHLYDPTRSAPQTRLYQAAYWHLMSHCQAFQKRREIPFQELLDSPTTIRNPVLKLLQEVGEEGRALLNAIFEAPRELLSELERPTRRVKKTILRDFLQRNGWQTPTFERGWNQVTFCLLN